MKVVFKKEDDRYRLHSYDDKLSKDFSEQEKEWFHRSFWFFKTDLDDIYKSVYYDLCVPLNIKFSSNYLDIIKSAMCAKVVLEHSGIQIEVI